MNKKKYITIGIIIIALILTTTFILIKTNNNKVSWIEEVLQSNNIEVMRIDCNNNQIKLDNNIIKEIEKYWNKLSDNGPWTGNNEACYEKIIINHDEKATELLIIDNSSLVLKTEDYNNYYVNAEELINYLNNQKH